MRENSATQSKSYDRLQAPEGGKNHAIDQTRVRVLFHVSCSFPYTYTLHLIPQKSVTRVYLVSQPRARVHAGIALTTRGRREICDGTAPRATAIAWVPSWPHPGPVRPARIRVCLRSSTRESTLPCPCYVGHAWVQAGPICSAGVPHPVCLSFTEAGGRGSRAGEQAETQAWVYNARRIL